MHIMERIDAVQAAMESDTPFLHATNMEDPLATIRNLATALCLLCESMESPHDLVVQELARTIGDKVRELEEEHHYFFRLHHPCPPLEEPPASDTAATVRRVVPESSGESA
jgi:hypothetical protein